MVSDYISKKAPLFYYSFRQVRQTNSGVSEIHAANKITIRKHSDFNKDGLEFLVYNCALSATPELCGGVRYTSIERDSSQRVDFYGKGFSGNGVPLNTCWERTRRRRSWRTQAWKPRCGAIRLPCSCGAR